MKSRQFISALCCQCSSGGADIPELVRDFSLDLQRAGEFSAEQGKAASNNRCEPCKSIENLLIFSLNYLVLGYPQNK